MKIVEMMAKMGHEQVLLCQDPSTGYRSIIAIHSTALGPAVGGTRCWSYASEEEALTDVLRLSRGMTYKNAVAGLNLGGGKAVLIGDVKKLDREKIFRAHGRFIDRLGGRFITAEDVGTTPADMEIIHQETEFVAGLAGRGGDPSPWTAQGVFRGIQAAAKFRWGTEDLTERKIAIQGCGSVGYHLAKELHRAGARLLVTDIDAERVRRAVDECGAESVEPRAIYKAQADIFAPCALGGILNDQTIPQLKVEIVAGAANNQLLEERHGDELAARNILYAPDYVINAGGVISGGVDLLGWNPVQVFTKVRGIYDTLLALFHIAKKEGIATYLAADRMAEQRLRQAREAKASTTSRESIGAR